MVNRLKDANVLQTNRVTADPGETQKHGTRPRDGTQAWSAFNKLPNGGKKMGLRNKVPFGPLGGSGRKTNLSRSS